MLNYNLQFFGGRGASGTLKNPNGKVAKSSSSVFDDMVKNGGIIVAKDGDNTITIYKTEKTEKQGWNNVSTPQYIVRNSSNPNTMATLSEKAVIDNWKNGNLKWANPNSKMDKYANDVRDYIKQQVGVDINKYRDIGADKSNPNNTVHYDNIRTGVVLNKHDISKTDMQRINQLVAKGQIEVSTSGTWILHVRKKK